MARLRRNYIPPISEDLNYSLTVVNSVDAPVFPNPNKHYTTEYTNPTLTIASKDIRQPPIEKQTLH